jgi:hypothetical protein
MIVCFVDIVGSPPADIDDLSRFWICCLAILVVLLPKLVAILLRHFLAPKILIYLAFQSSDCDST